MRILSLNILSGILLLFMFYLFTLVSFIFQGNLGRLKRNVQDFTSMNYWVVRDYYRLVESVNSLEPQIQSLSDEQVKLSVHCLRRFIY